MGFEVGLAIAVFIAVALASVGVAAGIGAAGRLRKQRERAQRERGFAADLAALRADPALAHWAPLVERHGGYDAGRVREWEARRQILLAHPTRRAFVSQWLDGQFIADEQIDYRLDPTARRTCEHLVALEGALRAADPTVLPSLPRGVDTRLAIDPDRTRAAYALADCVEWRRDAPSHPRADPEPDQFHCTRCDSTIRSGILGAFPPA